VFDPERNNEMHDEVGILRIPRMMRRACLVLVACVVALPGCQDYVYPGFAEESDAGSDAPSVTASTGSEATTPETVGGPADAAIVGVPSESDGAGVGDGHESERPSGPCDMSGRWLVALRTVTDALGTSQAAHEWYYYELAQSGTQLTVSKGLVCGENVRALSAASGNADFPKVWPAMMTKLTHTGRKGASSPTSGGCQVSFETIYETMSATVPYYLDPGHPLPTSSQQASAGTTGWEDWDQDGQPGYTMSITGIAAGQIYMVARSKFAMSGGVAASPRSFDLAVQWSSEQDVLGVNGPPILSMTAAAVKDSDPAQHFATFVRLTDAQATGDDTSVCAAMRSLAPTLAPSASN
jgi:hypothetical protein